jgi:hypothetical protein
MAVIVGPPIKKIYVQLIKQAIADLGRQVVIHLPPEEADCPNCIWSPTEKTSTNKFDSTFVTPVVIFGSTISPTTFDRGRCPICKGAGKLIKDVTKSIKALIKWNPNGPEDLQMLPVGREGTSVVRIKALPTNYSFIDSAVYFIVDGVKCEILQPQTIRALGTTEGMVVAYLQEVEVGKDTKK